METPFNWTCPHCGRDTTIDDHRFQAGSENLDRRGADGIQRLTWEFIVCPNRACGRFTFRCKLQEVEMLSTPWGQQPEFGKIWFDRRLVPSSAAQVFPEYIPTAIRQDYEESCAIVELSSKASATLAPRCLQGMIRDFWGISRPRFVQEIQELQDMVDPDVWNAIDAVRTVGNIGAHMEADINVIVDVDDGEAAKLIWLIELLMREWYIARYERQKRVQEVIAIAQEKQNAKTASKTAAQAEVE